ncbi:MAG: YggS family pyridoxal phosphate-dependent enzyme [Roseimicrobium sp.]
MSFRAAAWLKLPVSTKSQKILNVSSCMSEREDKFFTSERFTMQITLNLNSVHSKIVETAKRVGREPLDIQLIAVTKTFPVEVVREAVEAGHKIFGENKVQELLAKQPQLPSTLQWHLIGHLQSNKVRKVLPAIAAIHSVDSLDLARDINRIAAELGLFPKVFLEVNVAAEASKHGFAPATLEAELDALLALDRLEIYGFMCVPPHSGEPEDSRKHFVFLRELRDKMEARAGAPFPQLSMGMSNDYQIAVEEGSTHVRVGSAIFGSR